MGTLQAIEGFRSHILGNQRQLTIYLPDGYESSADRYPVLYLNDGQNLFEDHRAFVHGHTWQVKPTADHLIAAGVIRPLIIVGIDHAGERRIDEMAPTRDLRSGRGGQAKAYGRMITEEIKPFIDSRWRTLAGVNDTGLGGSSLGGLVTLYLGFRLPHIFGRLAIMSPSLWWDNKIMLNRLRMNRHAGRSRIWLDIGTREGRAYMQTVKNTRVLRDALTSRGWLPQRHLHYAEIEGGTHAEHEWARRLPQVLTFLFPREEPVWPEEPAPQPDAIW